MGGGRHEKNTCNNGGDDGISINGDNANEYEHVYKKVTSASPYGQWTCVGKSVV